MQGQTNRSILKSKLQRRLRRSMTNAEKKLWTFLRIRQIEGMKFRRQHPFGDYILDFVCLEKKIIIEIDGGQHQEQSREDDARTNALAKAGFTVLRFWNHDVLQQPEAVIERIWQEATRNNPSSPRPSP